MCSVMLEDRMIYGVGSRFVCMHVILWKGLYIVNQQRYVSSSNIEEKKMLAL
jgi:hypothetical protein